MWEELNARTVSEQQKGPTDKGQESARITLNASAGLHRAAKLRALELGVTMTEYVTTLILRDLDGREEHSS